MGNSIRFTRWSSVLVASLVTGSAFLFPAPARASEEGRRNTALALGAAAAYLLATKRDKIPGLVAAGGAAWAYKRYDDSIRDRKDRERYWGYRDSDRYRYGRYGRYDDGRYYRSRRNYDDDDRYYRSRRNRNGDRYYRASYGRTPPGWSKGRKTGWHKHSRNCRH